MRKPGWLSGAESRMTTIGGGSDGGDAVRRACRGVVGLHAWGVEQLEVRQFLSATIRYTFDNDPTADTAVDAALADGAQDATHQATQVAGKFGGGLLLDGDDSLRVSQVIDGRIGGTASVSFWIKTTQAGNNDPRQAPGLVGAAETEASTGPDASGCSSAATGCRRAGRTRSRARARSTTASGTTSR
jgi:hypothetical protein